MRKGCELYAVFDVKGKKRKFVDATQAVSSAQAAYYVSLTCGHYKCLVAELATPEQLRQYRKSEAKPKVRWRVHNAEGQPVGRQTSAVSMEQARTNIWFGKKRPDLNSATEEQKAELRTMTAKPIFGQKNVWRKPRRPKVHPSQQRLRTS